MPFPSTVNEGSFIITLSTLTVSSLFYICHSHWYEMILTDTSTKINRWVVRM